MQDVDCIAHVKTFPQPSRARRPRMQVKASRLVPCAKRPDGIVGDQRRRRNIGQRPSVRSPEPQLAVGVTFHLISLFVHGAVMAPAEHREVRKRGGPTLGPVADVVPLAERQSAAREAAAPIAMV